MEEKRSGIWIQVLGGLADEMGLVASDEGQERPGGSLMSAVDCGLIAGSRSWVGWEGLDIMEEQQPIVVVGVCGR